MKNAAARGLGMIMIFLGLAVFLAAYGYASGPAVMALGYMIGTVTFAVGATILIVFSKEK